jgi:hypothetical protein
MGVTGIAYDLVLNPLQKIHAELIQQAKQAKTADKKALRKLALKIATQLNRDVIRTLTTAGAPPYASIYKWMANIYQQITNQAAPANASPTYEDIITLQYSILGALESVAQINNKFPQLDPNTIGQNHRVLAYLEAISHALSKLANLSGTPVTFTAIVSDTIEKQLSSPHHLAVVAYLDVCGQAVEMWKGGTYTRPLDSKTIIDTDWFPLYLKQIYIAGLPPQ